ncbi:MAG: long-chain-fatty-acid--CoA ligase [Alphaproteobacteria bacterium]
MRLSHLVRRAAQTSGRNLATWCGGRRRNWIDVERRIARVAGGLAELGVRPGERVAILALNSDRYQEYYFAIPWAGAVFVPVNTRLAAPEMAYCLNDSGSTVACVDDELRAMLPTLLPLVPGVRHVIYMGDGAVPAGMVGYEDLAANGPAIADRGTDESDLLGIFYTGGTTGQAKGVMLSHRNMVTNSFDLVAALGLHENSRYLHAAPSFHIADGCNGLAVTLVGGSHMFMPRFDPVSLLQTVERCRVECTALVPTMVGALVNHPDIGNYDLSSLRRIDYGAAPMPEAVVRKLLQVLPSVELRQIYGQSEASPCITCNTHEYHALEGPKAKLKSAGRALQSVELRIEDANGNPLPADRVGEICLRGPHVMLGYWNQPAQTEAALRGGWLHTGDSGYLDDDGFLFIVDRLKDMIVTGGENVYSIEVENAVYRHAEVLECAVIGVPDEKWGERVHAIVRLKPGAKADVAALIAHCRGLIAGFKCPRSIEFRVEPLPMSGAGKILKAELRKPYWQGFQRGVN